MAQRFLSIKNFEQYQPNSKRTYPWIRLYKSLLLDRDFLKLDIQSRYIYVGLLILASETGNRIPNDVPYLVQRLSISVSHGVQGVPHGFHSGSTSVPLLDLKPLYRSGLLQASKTTKWRLDKREIREEERESESATAVPVLPLPRKRVSKPETEWPEGFSFNDRHKSIAEGLGLNVQNEFIKFKDKVFAKGWTYKDWDAGFRTWLNNAAEFKQARAR